jgi:16S rRNA (guanine527-N7)-methyltransferase
LPTPLLEAHRTLLEARRHAMNLVGPGPLAPHYDDAREAFVGLQPTGRWADLGSGAGFPGIPFAALFPEVALDLVESREKRATFVEAVLLAAAEAVGARSAPLRVIRGRVESLPSASYDGVMSRAFAPPPEALDHAARLLVPGGTALLLLQSDPVPEDPRFQRVRERTYRIEGRERRVVELRKLP